MHVYRVENDKGLGPLAAQGEFDNWGSYVPTPRERARLSAQFDLDAELDGGGPYPQFDGMGDVPPFPNGRFGFASLEQLRHWFCCGAIDALQEAGFRVVEYHASQIKLGRHQVYFCPASRIREIPWEDILLRNHKGERHGL